jgi:hypothetical protein
MKEILSKSLVALRTGASLQLIGGGAMLPGLEDMLRAILTKGGKEQHTISQVSKAALWLNSAALLDLAKEFKEETVNAPKTSSCLRMSIEGSLKISIPSSLVNSLGDYGKRKSPHLTVRDVVLHACYNLLLNEGQVTSTVIPTQEVVINKPEVKEIQSNPFSDLESFLED